jgi:DnaJ domain
MGVQAYCCPPAKLLQQYATGLKMPQKRPKKPTNVANKGLCMRYMMYVANAHLINELRAAGAILDVVHNGYDVVMARVPSGQQVAFHFIERDIDVRLIHTILAENEAKGIYTLFLLWCAMLLPDHGSLYPPYDWMQALLTLYHDRIYAFEAEGQQAWIFPVHFRQVPDTYKRLVRFGDPVNFAHLGIEDIQVESAHIRGRFRIADFEDRQSARERRQNPSKERTRLFMSYSNPLRAHFELLGVPIDADIELIRKAYRSLAMAYHPDLNKTPEANAKMQQINTAYREIMALLGEDNPA